MTLEEFFQDYESSRPIFEALGALIDSIGTTELRITKSQIAFWRRRCVARVWIPGQYLHGSGKAPLVLTLGFDQRDNSPRWKQIVEPAPGHFTHHLVLFSPGEVDEQVKEWLKAAWYLAA